MPSFRRRVRVRWTIIPFHYENSVSVPIHPVKNRLASETRAVLRTDGTISSSPHLGFGIQRKPRRKVWEAPTKMSDIRMTSEKVINCWHSSTGELGFYHLTFVMKMIYDLECSSRVDEWRIAIFSLDLFIIRRTPRYAESHHLLFVWSYPIYKSFSLWN